MTSLKGWTKESCYCVGNMLSSLDMHAGALKWFKRSLMIDPFYYEAMIVAGNECIELKLPKEAILYFSEALSKYHSFLEQLLISIRMQSREL